MAQPVLKDPSQAHRTSSVSHILVQTLQQHLLSNIGEILSVVATQEETGLRLQFQLPLANGGIVSASITFPKWVCQICFSYVLCVWTLAQWFNTKLQYFMTPWQQEQSVNGEYCHSALKRHFSIAGLWISPKHLHRLSMLVYTCTYKICETVS